MFTIDQIKTAHSKVKSGADFPQYIQDLIQLGVTGYETYVHDGHTVYCGTDKYTIASSAKYKTLKVEKRANKNQFQIDLLMHQQGKTDYPTFCSDCAKSGIEKWIVAMNTKTCTYYDKQGNEVLRESIPV
jgi:uncharacterized protein YbcV (DUF1398 family)